MRGEIWGALAGGGVEFSELIAENNRKRGGEKNREEWKNKELW